MFVWLLYPEQILTSNEISSQEFYVFIYTYFILKLLFAFRFRSFSKRKCNNYSALMLFAFGHIKYPFEWEKFEIFANNGRYKLDNMQAQSDDMKHGCISAKSITGTWDDSIQTSIMKHQYSSRMAFSVHTYNPKCNLIDNKRLLHTNNVTSC